MSNDDYNDPGPYTRPAEPPGAVHPAAVREHKAQLRAEAEKARDSDREHLATLDHDELVELAEAEGHSTVGSDDVLRARLMGDPEPSGTRFAP